MDGGQDSDIKRAQSPAPDRTAPLVQDRAHGKDRTVPLDRAQSPAPRGEDRTAPQVQDRAQSPAPHVKENSDESKLVQSESCRYLSVGRSYHTNLICKAAMYWSY